MHTITDLGDLHPPLPYVEVALQSLVPVLDLDVFHDIGRAAVGQLVTQPLTEGLFLGTFLQGGGTGERQVTVWDNIREMGEVFGRSVWAKERNWYGHFLNKGKKEEWRQGRRGTGLTACGEPIRVDSLCGEPIRFMKDWLTFPTRCVSSSIFASVSCLLVMSRLSSSDSSVACCSLFCTYVRSRTHIHTHTHTRTRAHTHN